MPDLVTFSIYLLKQTEMLFSYICSLCRHCTKNFSDMDWIEGFTKRSFTYKKIILLKTFPTCLFWTAAQSTSLVTNMGFYCRYRTRTEMHTSTALVSEQLPWGTELSAQEPASQTRGPRELPQQTEENTWIDAKCVGIKHLLNLCELSF